MSLFLSPSAHSTARRNLAQRIERFLREQVAMPTPTMKVWQADQVFVAIELLDGQHFADGEHALLKAEKALIFEPADYVLPFVTAPRSCWSACSGCSRARTGVRGSLEAALEPC